jgi:hypothetical protein
MVPYRYRVQGTLWDRRRKCDAQQFAREVGKGGRGTMIFDGIDRQGIAQIKVERIHRLRQRAQNSW